MSRILLLMGMFSLLLGCAPHRLETWADCELRIGQETRSYRCPGASARVMGGSRTGGEGRSLKAGGGANQFLLLDFRMPDNYQGELGVPFEVTGGRSVAPGQPSYELEIESGKIVFETERIEEDTPEMGHAMWAEILEGHYEATGKLTHPVVKPTGPKLSEYPQHLREATAQMRGRFQVKVRTIAKGPHISITPKPLWLKERVFGK